MAIRGWFSGPAENFLTGAQDTINGLNVAQASFTVDVASIAPAAVVATGGALLSALMAYELIMIFSRSNTLNDVDAGTYVRWAIKVAVSFFFFNNATAIAQGLTELSTGGGVGAFVGIVSEASSIASLIGLILVAYGVALIGLGVNSNDPNGINKGAMTAVGGSLMAGVVALLAALPGGEGGGGIINAADGASPNVSFAPLIEMLDTLDMGALILVWLISAFLMLFTLVLPALLHIVMIAMSFEIAIYVAMAPIPLATMGSEEFSEIGRGYLKKCIGVGLRLVVILITLSLLGPVVEAITGPLGQGGDGGLVGALGSIMLAFGGLAAFVKVLFASKDIANSIVGA